MGAGVGQVWNVPKKILIAFGSRADAGLLFPILIALQQEQDFECSTLAIDGDGRLLEVFAEAKLSPDAILKFNLPHTKASSGDVNSRAAVANAMGQITSKSSEVLMELSPDLLIILGDRYEIFAVASAATALTIPMAHMCGGDVTLGANDDVYRHAISKMSHLHFPSNKDAANRLVSMGENPLNVHVVGNPSLDAMYVTEAMAREDFFTKVGLQPRKQNILATFHPETLSDLSPFEQLKPVLDAFAKLGDTVGILITAANLDAGGDEINTRILEFSDQHENVIFYPNLGFSLYHAGLIHCDVVVGNSSSGLYETPSFNCATVNIGNRQGGRLKASSVIDCKNDAVEILNAITRAFELDCQDVENPYGDGHAVKRMMLILKSIYDPKKLLLKGFYEGEKE